MNDTLAILEKLNSLYAGTLNTLVMYTVGVLAFVGVAIPGFIGFIQSRQLKADHAALSLTIKLEIEAATKTLKEEIARLQTENETKLTELIEKTDAEIRDELLKIKRGSLAASLHLQANSNIARMPMIACLDALCAIHGYAESGSESNIAAVVRIFFDTIVKVDRDFYNARDFDRVSESTLASLKKLDVTGRYSADILSIKAALAIAKVQPPLPLPSKELVNAKHR